jgi:hypothetical protein
MLSRKKQGRNWIRSYNKFFKKFLSLPSFELKSLWLGRQALYHLSHSLAKVKPLEIRDFVFYSYFSELNEMFGASEAGNKYCLNE